MTLKEVIDATELVVVNEKTGETQEFNICKFPSGVKRSEITFGNVILEDDCCDKGGCYFCVVECNKGIAVVYKGHLDLYKSLEEAKVNFNSYERSLI